MTKVDLSKYNNDWYKPGKNGFVRMIWYCINAVFINTYHFPSSGLKKFLLKLFGAKIGIGVVISKKVNIKYPWKLEIGDFSWIGEDVWIDNLDNVIIGKNACLSQGAMLLCGNHNFRSSTFDLITQPITLKNGAWVGAKAVVCPGVTLNENSILTVNSTATKDLEANGIYQGTPAKLVKQRVIEA